MMRLRLLLTAIILGAVFIIPQKSSAEVSFANVGAGATSDGGFTVTDPTVFILNTPVTTRYLRIEVKNDGTYAEAGYLELRNIKAWTDGSENVLNGIHSGGNAKVVEIDGYNGATPYETDFITDDCSSEWFPSGSLCDEIPNTDSKTVSYKNEPNSGATWDIGSADDVGVLVIDMDSVRELNELRVFQMFSDGKITHIRFAYHSEMGNTPPAWDDVGWSDFTDIEGLPDPPQEEQANSEEVIDEDEEHGACYKEYKRKYSSDSYKQDYQKVKELKKKENDVYLKMKGVYFNYKVVGDNARKILKQRDPNTYQMYKEYRRYRKYKKYKECR